MIDKIPENKNGQFSVIIVLNLKNIFCNLPVYPFEPYFVLIVQVCAQQIASNLQLSMDTSGVAEQRFFFLAGGDFCC